MSQSQVSMGIMGATGLVGTEMLRILERFDLTALGHNEPEYIRVIAEAMKTGIRPRHQAACAMARRLVMVLVPIGVVPLRLRDVGTRT